MVNLQNKRATKKNYKPDKPKKLVPPEVKLKKRKDINAKSAQRSHQRKKEEQAKKEIEVEEMALKNRKLTEQVETLEPLKELFETLRIFGTRNQIGTIESDPGRMQSAGEIPKAKVEDVRYCFLTPLPDLIFQENDDSIEATSSIENSYSCIRNILKLLLNSWKIKNPDSSNHKVMKDIERKGLNQRCIIALKKQRLSLRLRLKFKKLIRIRLRLRLDFKK